MNTEEIVALSIKYNISDLYLCSAWPARWRIRGRMEAAPLDAPDVEGLLREWLDGDQWAILLENGQLGFIVSLTENQRLRGSAFAQRQGISPALRLLLSYCPQLRRPDAPPVLPELFKSKNGLILMTGVTGSGKSTTLAAMVGYLNQHADAHIPAPGDPVEHLYTGQRCLIQQWETGLCCMVFAPRLWAALREDPDVILLGELRDSKAIHLALAAAETRHLVLAILYTHSAAQVVERLVGSFSTQEEDPVRSQLAGGLQTVLSQKLEVDRQEGHVMLFELLINAPAMRDLTHERGTHQLPRVIQTGQQMEMMTFQQSYQQRMKGGRL